jgi:hypothetical protein
MSYICRECLEIYKGIGSPTICICNAHKSLRCINNFQDKYRKKYNLCTETGKVCKKDKCSAKCQYYIKNFFNLIVHICPVCGLRANIPTNDYSLPYYCSACWGREKHKVETILEEVFLPSLFKEMDLTVKNQSKFKPVNLIREFKRKNKTPIIINLNKSSIDSELQLTSKFCDFLKKKGFEVINEIAPVNHQLEKYSKNKMKKQPKKIFRDLNNFL